MNITQKLTQLIGTKCLNFGVPLREKLKSLCLVIHMYV